MGGHLMTSGVTSPLLRLGLSDTVCDVLCVSVSVALCPMAFRFAAIATGQVME